VHPIPCQNPCKSARITTSALWDKIIPELFAPKVILTPSDLDDNACIASARRAVAMFNGAGAMQSSVELEQSGSAP
jgi:hypothetical protein